MMKCDPISISVLKTMEFLYFGKIFHCVERVIYIYFKYVDNVKILKCEFVNHLKMNKLLYCDSTRKIDINIINIYNLGMLIDCLFLYKSPITAKV